MTAVAVLLIVLVVTVPATVWRGRRRQIDPGPIPWDLADLARRQITVLAGQAAVAVTAVVLLVTTLQATASRSGLGGPSPAFDTVLAMFLIAFLSFVGVAVQFALLPSEERNEGSLLPRFLAQISGIQHYRTLFLGWLALKPLVDAFGLTDAAWLLEWLLGGAAMTGWLIVASLCLRMGVLSTAEAFLTPTLGVVLAIGLGLVASLPSDPGAGASAVLVLTVAVFVMNALTFAAHAIAPVLWRTGWGRTWRHTLARAYVLADLQATVVVLALIWTWLLRPY